MTCIEKYKLEHDGKVPDVTSWCPNISGGIDIEDPGYCCFGRDGECLRCWNREVPDTEPAPDLELASSPDPEPVPTTDVVNHPEHYCREGAMECIDEMLLVFGTEATQIFCLMNAWKYRYRAADKNGEEDLKKSDWYIAKYAELKGGE